MIGAVIAGDQAQSLRLGAQKIGTALLALEAYDLRYPLATTAAVPGSAEAVLASERRRDRDALLRVAAEAVWALLVQREVIGLVDHEYLRRELRVPDEVWCRLGAGAEASL